MPYGILSFTANNSEKSRFCLPCAPLARDNTGMNKKVTATDPQTAARRFAATRRAMGAGAFERLADTTAPEMIDYVLQNDPVWLPLRREMPWLPDLARLEAMAADAIQETIAPHMDLEKLEKQAKDPMKLRFSLQRHVRTMRSGWDIPALWQKLAAGETVTSVAAVESFTVLYNDDGNCAVWSVTEAAYAVLESLDTNPDFAAAAALAFRIDKDFALDQFLALLIQQRLLLRFADGGRK